MSSENKNAYPIIELTAETPFERGVQYGTQAEFISVWSIIKNPLKNRDLPGKRPRNMQWDIYLL